MPWQLKTRGWLKYGVFFFKARFKQFNANPDPCKRWSNLTYFIFFNWVGNSTTNQQFVKKKSLSTWVSNIRWDWISSLQWPIESPEKKEDHGLLPTNTESFIGVTTTKLARETGFVDPWSLMWESTIVSPRVLMVQKSGDHQLIW